MKAGNELSLEEIKDIYGRFIDDAVIQCINEYGGLDVDYLKGLIGRIWVYQVIPNSRHLDEKTIASIRKMFDEVILSLDSTKNDLNDCIALMNEEKVQCQGC